MIKQFIVGSVMLLLGEHVLPDGQTDAGIGSSPEEMPRAPAAGGPRRWQPVSGRTLAVRDKPFGVAPVIESVSDSTLLSNLGCQISGQDVWCHVETLKGKMRGYVLAKQLRPAVGPDGSVPMGPDMSKLRARQGDFDVQGTIPCAQEIGQEMGECTASVARGNGGDAAVVAGFSNGFKRTLYFVHGKFVRANPTMSGSGSDIDWILEDDVHRIRVDDQRYELDDHFMFDD